MVWLLTSGVLGGFMGCTSTHEEVTHGRLRLAGTGGAEQVLRAEADSFSVRYRNATIEMLGGGTVGGLEAMLNREADVAVISRDLNDAERQAAREAGADLALYAFAHDGIAVIVHPKSQVYGIAAEEAAGIFAGRITDWGEVGGAPGWIRVYTTGVEDGATGYVRKTLMGGVEFLAGAGRALTTRAVADSVAEHEDAIGYASMADLTERVKALPLAPLGGGPLKVLDVETVYRKEYPLVRTLYFGTRSIPRDNLISGFISYVMSTEGQKIVLDQGLVPATVPLRIKREN
jgi:phosphate transport system substrate-binding protein